MPEYDEAAVERVTAVKRAATGRLLALPGVNLVAVGGKEVGGEPTGELVIQVWVDRKVPLAELPPEQRIPEEIDGVRTDVYEGGRKVLLAEPGSFFVDDTDDRRYRPAIIGGGRIEAKGGPGKGTMGCVLHDPADIQVAYGLTNQHVIRLPPDPPATPGETLVGQPSDDSSSTACCDDIVGVYTGGSMADPRDEALFALRPGTRYVFDIQGIGYISGRYDATAADAAANVAVRKRGARTRLTGGVLMSTDATSQASAGDLIIRPNLATGAKAGDLVFFAAEGDSGSALVDDATAGSCRVVGLVYARSSTRAELQAGGATPPALPADGIERVYAYAKPISAVLARFAATENVTVVVPTATAAGQEHTVPGAARVAVPAEVADRITADAAGRAAFLGEVGVDGGLRAPVGRGWFAEGRPREADLAALRDGLDATPAGRLLIGFWLAHSAELNRLVRTDRRVTLAWHRGGGAAIMQLLVHMVSRPELALPETVHGRPVLDCADDLIDALSARGGERLRADLRRVRAVLPDLGGRTLPEIMVALGAPPQPVGAQGQGAQGQGVGADG